MTVTTMQFAFDEVVAWQAANVDLVKMPDHAHVPTEEPDRA